MSDADKVFQSYGRSCNNPAFYEDFYNNFMSKSPEIRAMFVNTNMESQRALLRGGIMWLVMHARGMSDAKIRALGESHSRHKLNINPMYYSMWLDALLETIRKHDPQYDTGIEQSWRNALRPSIELIQSMY